MKTNDLYAAAENAGIQVLQFPLPACHSVSLETDSGMVIGMDNVIPFTCQEEHAHLGHELGHCLYGGFYTRCTPFDVVERHEYRADKWYITHAIPRQILFDLLRKGYDAWEIAEHLGTTEDYIRRAYYYYKENA